MLCYPGNILRVRGNARNEQANGGREARGGAARHFERYLEHKLDVDRSCTPIAGFTAPVRRSSLQGS